MNYPSEQKWQERDEWASRFWRCWICGDTKDLQTHEIASKAKAPRRWADPANYFRACGYCNCHLLNHLPEALQLAYKRHYDPDRYDRVLVNRLRSRADNAISDGEVMNWLYFVRRIAR